MTKKYNDTKSADEIDMKEIKRVDSEKIVLDDILGKYKNGLFELFNIIANNIDQATQKRGFGEQIIRESG